MRGGKRKGAGRKPSEVSLEPFTLRLDPNLSAKFRKDCEGSRISQSKLFANMVKQWTTTP